MEIPKILTRELLEAYLHQTVRSFGVRKGSKKGDNVAGSIYSITVNSEGDQSKHLVFKTLPEDQNQHDFVVSAGIFRLEICVYEHVIPKLYQFLKKRCPNQELTLPCPEFYGAMSNDKNDFLIMSDLRAQDYKMPDKFTTLNFDEMAIVLQKIAEFHSTTHHFLRFEGDNWLNGEDLRPIMNNPFFQQSEKNIAGMGFMVHGHVQNSATVLKAIDSGLAATVTKFLESHDPFKIGKLITEAAVGTDKTYFPCFVHGDLWVNNILIKYDKNLKPVDAKFVDFQMTRRGNIFEELGYFVITSSTPEFRKQHLAQLLMLYYDSFCQRTIKLGYTLENRNIGRGFLIENFYKLMKGFFIYYHFAIPLQLGDPSFQTVRSSDSDSGKLTLEQKLHKSLIDRIALSYEQLKNSPEAIARLQNVCREMVTLGLW